jgi:hypothetical protein
LNPVQRDQGPSHSEEDAIHRFGVSEICNIEQIGQFAIVLQVIATLLKMDG